MKLLLIQPRAPESFWSFRWALDSVLVKPRAVNPPLGLATVAALTPAEWQIEIVDENIESVPLETDADIVGVCGMGVHFARQVELLTYYRSRGKFVVAGGSYASLCPEKYDGVADAVITGEAEYIWKEFCRDYSIGSPRSLYRETGVVSLADSPVPRFDLLKLDRYSMVSLQFSRGCPFRCEFCDIIVMFGRTPRAKSPAQIRLELDALRSLGVRSLFFVDDNFIGDRRRAKELLRDLADYQREYRWTFRFGTEASLNMAQDAELLQLFREANFQWVFIGIESPDEESLRETGKMQNTREDMLTSLRRIYAAGIEIFGGFIVGFDNDTVETFERQRRFVMRSGIQVAMVGLLTAMPRTPLFERLRREGRLRTNGDAEDNTRLQTNIVPKRMSGEAMIAAYRELYRKLSSHRGIADRIIAKLRDLRPPAESNALNVREQLALVWRLMIRGIRPGGVPRLWHFLRSLGAASPRQVPVVISDWVCGLSMRSYAERFLLVHPARSTKIAELLVRRLRLRLRKHLSAGTVELSLQRLRQEVSIRFGNAAEPRALRHAARQLRRLLRKSCWSVSLHFEEIGPEQRQAFRRMLRRLRRYGDRISISVSKRLSSAADIDTSCFHLVLSSHSNE